MSKWATQERARCHRQNLIHSWTLLCSFFKLVSKFVNKNYDFICRGLYIRMYSVQRLLTCTLEETITNTDVARRSFVNKGFVSTLSGWKDIETQWFRPKRIKAQAVAEMWAGQNKSSKMSCQQMSSFNKRYLQWRIFAVYVIITNGHKLTGNSKRVN